jgi:hypothetical protein
VNVETVKVCSVSTAINNSRLMFRTIKDVLTEVKH